MPGDGRSADVLVLVAGFRYGAPATTLIRCRRIAGDNHPNPDAAMHWSSRTATPRKSASRDHPARGCR
jgi:hypothetical protein